MHIAILVTNTDDSPFAARHPRDSEKFGLLILSQRPDWKVSAFDLPKDEFPDQLEKFDGFLIGGSPASANDEEPWIDRLNGLVREIVISGRPLFGACFGHQAIATALGGKVERNPGGFVLGSTETKMHSPAPWMVGDGGSLQIYAAHLEQVTVLPKGAEVIGGNADCPIGSFAMGSRVFTTQYHPEMKPDFIAALVEELAWKLPPDAAAHARASLAKPAETDRFAEWIARFFEMA